MYITCFLWILEQRKTVAKSSFSKKREIERGKHAMSGEQLGENLSKT